jgi:hypothetical protein
VNAKGHKAGGAGRSEVVAGKRYSALLANSAACLSPNQIDAVNADDLSAWKQPSQHQRTSREDR